MLVAALPSFSWRLCCLRSRSALACRQFKRDALVPARWAQRSYPKLPPPPPPGPLQALQRGPGLLCQAMIALGIEGSANKIGVGIVRDDGEILSNPRHT